MASVGLAAEAAKCRFKAVMPKKSLGGCWKLQRAVEAAVKLLCVPGEGSGEMAGGDGPAGGGVGWRAAD